MQKNPRGAAAPVPELVDLANSLPRAVMPTEERVSLVGVTSGSVARAGAASASLPRQLPGPRHSGRSLCCVRPPRRAFAPCQRGHGPPPSASAGSRQGHSVGRGRHTVCDGLAGRLARGSTAGHPPVRTNRAEPRCHGSVGAPVGRRRLPVTDDVGASLGRGEAVQSCRAASRRSGAAVPAASAPGEACAPSVPLQRPPPTPAPAVPALGTPAGSKASAARPRHTAAGLPPTP